MLNRIFGINTHSYLHIIGLSGIAVGIPFNKVVLSISMLFIVLNLLLEGDFKNYLSNIKKNKSLHYILVFFGIHLISFLWTSNIDYALNDLRIKLPLLVIAVIMAARPLTIKHRDLLLYLFLGSVLITSLINYCLYQHWIGNMFYDDIRGMSIFISHVRYSIIVILGVAIALYFITKNKFKWFMVIAIIWLLYYTAYSQIISGILALISMLAILPIYFFYKKRKLLLIGVYFILFGAVSYTSFWLFETMPKPEVTILELPKQTKEGNKYRHSYDGISPESGEGIGLYYCEKELRREWNKRSDIDFDSKDVRGNQLKANLRRYMTSIGLKKDAIGFSSLTDQDINKVENGCASVYCKGLIARLYGIKYGLVNESNPNGSSFLQRIEYWKTGWTIFSNNPLIGVGSGDIQDSFDNEYKKSNSLLTKDHRFRTHNMFLTIALTFGILALIFFIWMHLEFILYNWKNQSIVALSFIAIILSSYLIEDTLETQVGISLFAFFYMLYPILKKPKSHS